MVNKTKSILISNIKVRGNITEKGDIVVDGNVKGNIRAENIETYNNSNIQGNIASSKVSIGGKLKGDVNSDKVHIKKTAEVEGTIKQKILSKKLLSSAKN